MLYLMLIIYDIITRKFCIHIEITACATKNNMIIEIDFHFSEENDEHEHA